MGRDDGKMSALFGPNTTQMARIQAKATGKPATTDSSETKPKPGVPGKSGPGRARNARELRQGYIRAVNAPDGLDPQPLTFPRAVECGHCGWPVFPRDARPATKKTYARAGMETGKKKAQDEQAAKDAVDVPHEEPDLDDDGLGDDDDNSSGKDTVEELEEEVEELRQKNEQLEQDKELLEEKVKELEEELKGTREELNNANETISYLEDAQQQWRDKLSRARTEINRHLLYIDRLAARREDLETDLKVWIQETLTLRKTVAKRRRRRNLMLDCTERQHAESQRHDVKGLVVRMWRHKAREIKLQRLLRLLEERRHREFVCNTANIFNLWQRKIHLDHWVAYLKRRLKDAAHMYLQKCMSTSKGPWAHAHALRAWSAATPVLYTENRLQNVIQDLASTKKNLALEAASGAASKLDVAQLSRERDRLRDVEIDLTERVAMLEEQLGGNAAAAAEARRLAEKEKEEALRRAVAAVEAKLAALQDEWETEKEEMQMQIANLEGRLAAAEANAGGGKDGQMEDDSWRIVPKGQGVTCVGCLRQLVHRTVQPLPPVTALKMAKGEFSPRTLDKMKKRFFEEELDGLINPNDEIATTMYMNQKDPYKLARLNMWPLNVRPQEATYKKTAANADLYSKAGDPLSMSMASTMSPTASPLSPGAISSLSMRATAAELPSLADTVKKPSSRWPVIHPPGKGGMKDRAKSHGHFGLGQKQEGGGMRETFSKDFKKAFR